MAAIGWNAVRLLVSWSRVEPEPGRYDRGVSQPGGRHGAEAEPRSGIYTIVDLHQDAWGPSLAARPGETCAAAHASGRSAGTERPPGRRSTAEPLRCVPGGHARAQPGG